MNTLTATYRIVTPMFLGDANQDATDIRPPSIKGALRFWWRAMMWGQIRNSFENDMKALEELHRQEAELFGSAADENGGGQGKFLLKVEKNALKPSELKKKKLENHECGIQYLLGLGLYDFRSGYLRNALTENQIFLVSLCFRGEIDNSIIDALKLFGLLGGLGSRSRRGFGSVVLQSIKQKDDELFVMPKNEKEYGDALKKLFPNLVNSLPPFSAFSRESRVDISMQGTSTLELLNNIGKQMQLHRSWGNNGRVCGATAERNFLNDHHLMDNVLNQGNNLIPEGFEHPERIIFGLPHNYFFSSTHTKTEIAPSEKEQSRRASPLLIHIHEFSDKSCIAVQILLASSFLLANNKLKIGSKLVSANPDWNVIKKYLDRQQFLKKLILP